MDLTGTLRLELLLQLTLAVLLGGVIGLERELKGKPAGLRTNILICIGAVLYTALSLHIGAGRGDPGRIAAQILPGVGFIGAGTILHTRGSVTGLTSAATIWVVAAIGLALGSAAYVEAIGATVLVMVVLLGLGWAENALGRYTTTSRVTLHLTSGPSGFEDVMDVVRRTGLQVVLSRHQQEGPDQVLELELRGPRRLHEEMMSALVRHPAVRSASTGE